MLPDWETNCVLVADLLQTGQPGLLDNLTRILDAHGLALRTVSDCRDIWIRDAAPVQVDPGQFVQFRYWPDYLRGRHRHLITGPEPFERLDFTKNTRRTDLIVDGGNVVGTRTTAVMTDKVVRENPQHDRLELQEELRRLLRVERLILIPEEPGDIFGHADGMLRFIDDDSVVVNDYSSVDRNLGQRLERRLEEHGRLRIERLPYRPETHRNRDGVASAAGNYVNFLRVGDLIILPSFGRREDADVLRRFERLCPATSVVSLPCLNLARQGGVLNCVTWTVQIDGR